MGSKLERLCRGFVMGYMKTQYVSEALGTINPETLQGGWYITRRDDNP